MAAHTSTVFGLPLRNDDDVVSNLGHLLDREVHQTTKNQL